MVRSQALCTLAATSGWLMCTSISTAPSRRPEGLARFWPARRGAEPWMASNMAQLSPMLADPARPTEPAIDRKSTRLNSSHLGISYAVFCLKKSQHHLEQAVRYARCFYPQPDGLWHPDL